MDALLNSSAPPTGDEWFSPGEYAEHYKMHHRSACNKLSFLAKRGMLEVWRGRIPGTTGVQTRYRIASGLDADKTF